MRSSITPGGQFATQVQQRIGAFLRRKKASQFGTPQTITATAHKLARLIYSKLKYGHADQDYYESQYRERSLRNLTRRAKELGYNLVAAKQPPPSHLPMTSNNYQLLERAKEPFFWGRTLRLTHGERKIPKVFGKRA